MRILVAVWSIRVGGAETFAIQLCEYLQSKGHLCYLFPIVGPWDDKYFFSIRSRGIKILTPFSPGMADWIAWKLNSIMIRVFRMNFRHFITKLFYKYIIRKYSFDCVISNSILSDNFIIEQKNVSRPFVVIEHGEYSYKLIDQENFTTKVLSEASKVVFVSRWCKELFRSKLSINFKSEVIYNGHIKLPIGEIPEGYRHQLRNVFVFGMVGRGVKYKGWEEGIKAFLKVNVHNVNTRLLLIGEGIFLDELKIKYGENPAILFAGRQINPQDWIQYVDVGLILSHKYEAFGITILDFFAQKKPVIATNVGGIPEVVNPDPEKSGGIMVSIDENGKPQIFEVVAAMELMMKDKNLRRQFAEQTSEIYKRFSFEQTGLEYLKLVAEVSSKRR